MKKLKLTSFTNNELKRRELELLFGGDDKTTQKSVTCPSGCSGDARDPNVARQMVNKMLSNMRILNSFQPTTTTDRDSLGNSLNPVPTDTTNHK